jgi:SHS2 domain-containing protein
MTSCSYEELSHTAEVGMRVRAATRESLFACAARGLFTIAGVEASSEVVQRAITIESIDTESLLVDWLSELIYLHETTGEVYDEIAIESWTPTQLSATLSGARATEPAARSIKAVTYYGLRLEQTEDGWLAEVYFDI